MKRILVLFVLLAMTVVAVAQDKAKASSKSRGDVAQTITNFENQWAKDSSSGNAAEIGGMLADDFVNLDSDGTTYGKTETLPKVEKAKWDTNELTATSRSPPTAIMQLQLVSGQVKAPLVPGRP